MRTIGTLRQARKGKDINMNHIVYQTSEAERIKAQKGICSSPGGNL